MEGSEERGEYKKLQKKWRAEKRKEDAYVSQVRSELCGSHGVGANMPVPRQAAAQGEDEENKVADAPAAKNRAPRRSLKAAVGRLFEAKQLGVLRCEKCLIAFTGSKKAREMKKEHYLTE